MPESIEHQVLLAVEAVCESVTTANGYLTNVQEVMPGDAVMDEYALQMPAILTTFSDTQSDPRFHSTDHQVLGLTLVLIHSGVQDDTGRLLTSRMIADVKTALKGHFYGTAYPGQGITPSLFDGVPVVNLETLGHQRWTERIANVATTGAAMKVAIHYREDELDPYSGPPVP